MLIIVGVSIIAMSVAMALINMYEPKEVGFSVRDVPVLVFIASFYCFWFGVYGMILNA